VTIAVREGNREGRIEVVGEGNIVAVSERGWETELSERVSGWERETLCEATDAIKSPCREIETLG
jgi:hypothetical protein